MNDFYSAGLNDDRFALLYNANTLVNIAVKTPVGRTDRKSIKNVITQGDVFSPMFCSKTVDTISKECLQTSNYTYFYMIFKLLFNNEYITTKFACPYFITV